MLRNNINDRCTKSWQTPLPSFSASSPDECTLVVPGRYSSSPRTQSPTATTALAGSCDLAIFLATDATRLLAGTCPVGRSSSSKRSITASECRSPQPSSVAGRSARSVSTTDEDITVRSVCGACRSNAVTAVPQ